MHAHPTPEPETPTGQHRYVGDCNCLAVRQAARYVTQFYDQQLAPSGLRATQFSILVRLRLKGPMTINVLAAQMIMDRTTLGRNIRPLERDGLIEVRQGATDRRNKELHLTDAGSARVRAGVKLWAEAQDRFEEAYGAGRAATLRGLLHGVVATDLGTSGLAAED